MHHDFKTVVIDRVGKMNIEIWQRLLPLQSQDITRSRFAQIHSRNLNARRAREINAAAKQAREFFKNASLSDHSVRPLMTHYGVVCLAKALVLLLRVENGEEGLVSGHGIETVEWGRTMSGETAEGLSKLGELKIRTTNGLFSDLVSHTTNKSLIHVRSAGVDWRLPYGIPNKGVEINVADLFSRIPDLQADYSILDGRPHYAYVNEMTFNFEQGFSAKLNKKQFEAFQSSYLDAGYAVTSDDTSCELTCDAGTFAKYTPLFMHQYIKKMFGSIPTLFLAEQLPGGAQYSQLCMTYLVSFVLGMLVRYYPTHWITLIQGGKGDLMWPTISRAQQVVEESFPELVAELIDDTLRDREE